jgi:hypothetical protein
MDYEGILTDAFAYIREGIWENTDRWLKLILALILLGIPFNGYVMRVYRGAHPAPDVDQWGTLFIDGLKLLVIGIIYAVPIVVIWMFILGSMILTGMSESAEAAIATSGINVLLMMVMYVYEIAIAVIMPIASIRFARTGAISEAFNFGAIFGTIGRIGWLNYIIAILLIGLVTGIPMLVLIFGMIFIAAVIAGASLMLLKSAGLFILLALIGLMLLFILAVVPFFGIFQARCMTRVYDSAIPEAQPVP